METETAGTGLRDDATEDETMAGMATGTGMKINVARDELVAKLGVVSRAVSTRGTVQVLSGILLRAEGDVLTLAATDMELSLRTTLDARVEGDGAVVIPGKPLVELARLLPESDVTIEYRPEEGTVHIVSGSYSSRLHVFNAEDFPRLPAVDAQLHAIDREALLETIDRVARSASRDESRPVLTGILVRFEAGKLVMVATDSYRLSVKETELDSGRAGARGDHPGARADRAVAPRRRRHRRARRPREPCRLRHRLGRYRRRLADDAPDRRPVPELPPAAA